MTLRKIYYLTLGISAGLYLLYWFAPWTYGYLDEEQQSLLSYGGHGALLVLPDGLWWLLLLATLLGYLGMALFRNSFRILFLAVLCVSVLISVIGGASVVTGPEAFFVDVSNFMAGFAVALSYYTELNEKFY
ncbi:MAG TPA: hypothetical protein VIR60_10880 [Gammaproteobacteria bacterium]